MSNTLISATSFTIMANQAWQQTGIVIPANMAVTIAYESGLWTANPDTNGGQPYDANGCETVAKVPADHTCYPLTGVNEGALVGRVNGGEAFLVGTGPYTILLDTGGALELCINDDLNGCYGAGLKDNHGSVTVFIYPANTQPDTGAPLVQEPTQASPGAPLSQLGALQHLIGTWTNQNLPGTNRGGPDAPYSYNVMPLPQVDPSSPYGYILKNFSYYEELTFTAIHGTAPNRGGIGQQVAFTLFYEQRVYFAEGPNKDALVHAENGSMLLLLDQTQPLGPYGNGDRPGLGNQVVQNSVPPTQAFNIAKQVAVPHGNSILALGNYSAGSKGQGAPAIPVVSALPEGVNTQPYQVTDPVSNPSPELTANPNLALTQALQAKAPKHFVELKLSTSNGKGTVANIGFEQQHADVAQYDFTYWLESFDDSENYTQLQYSQTITMRLPINGKMISFPHVTANTLTKVQ